MQIQVIHETGYIDEPGPARTDDLIGNAELPPYGRTASAAASRSELKTAEDEFNDPNRVRGAKYHRP